MGYLKKNWNASQNKFGRGCIVPSDVCTSYKWNAGGKMEPIDSFVTFASSKVCLDGACSKVIGIRPKMPGEGRTVFADFFRSQSLAPHSLNARLNVANFAPHSNALRDEWGSLKTPKLLSSNYVGLAAEYRATCLQSSVPSPPPPTRTQYKLYKWSTRVLLRFCIWIWTDRNDRHECFLKRQRLSVWWWQQRVGKRVNIVPRNSAFV